MPRQKPKPDRKVPPKRVSAQAAKPADRRQKPPDHHDTLAGSGMEQEPTR